MKVSTYTLNCIKYGNPVTGTSAGPFDGKYKAIIGHGERFDLLLESAAAFNTPDEATRAAQQFIRDIKAAYPTDTVTRNQITSTFPGDPSAEA